VPRNPQIDPRTAREPTLRAVGAVLRFALARIRHRPARGLLTALGVAIAVGAMAFASAERVIAGDRALRAAIRDLPVGQRVVNAIIPRQATSPEELAAAEREARTATEALGQGPARQQLAFADLADRHGVIFRLAALDGLARMARVTSGRAPSRCNAAGCEVLYVGAGSPPALDPSLGLTIVGQGAITDPAVLAGSFAPVPGTPLLVAPSVAGVQELTALSVFPRSYALSVPVPDDLRIATLAGYLARASALSDQLSLRSTKLELPADTLRATAARARVASRRLLVVGGEVAALMLVFVAVAALGLRRDHAAAVRVLEHRGATRRATALFTAADSAWPVAAGTVAGLAAATFAVAVAADSAGLPSGATARAAIDGSGPAAVLAVVLASWAIAGWVLRARHGGRADLVALALIAATVLAASRGTTTSETLARGTDPLLAALPVCAVAAAAIITGRLVPLALRLFTAVAPVRAPLARIALADALRRPARPLATAGFCSAAVALAVFAAAYRATLTQGAVDQAAFAVPFDATLSVGPSLVLPRNVGDDARFAALVPGGAVAQVLRRAGVVRSPDASSAPVELLGVDAPALTHMSRYRSDYATIGAQEIARRIGTGGGTRAVPLPPQAVQIHLTTTGNADAVQIGVVVRAADGAVQVVETEAGPHGLTAAVPAGATGIAGFTIRQPPYQGERIQHHEGEGNSAAAHDLTRVSITGVAAVPGGSMPMPWASMTGDGAKASANSVTVQFRPEGRTFSVHVPQPTDGVALPGIVDAATAAAARGGVVTVAVGPAVVPIAVRGTARRFPTVGDRFVILDRRTLQTALDAAAPGSGIPDELWLKAADDAGARQLESTLTRDPYAVLASDFRLDRQAVLEADPLARGVLALLALASVVALTLAALAVAIGVVGDRRDAEGELLALEADGATPAGLRRLLVVRAVAPLLVAVPVGALAGAILARAVADLVAVSAAATETVPPLLDTAGTGLGVAGALAVLLGGCIAAAVTAAAAFREPDPRRPEAATP
jgi:hypothetical protein